jgi:KDO2-lipid IV(A) lauroyltransferase
MQQVADAFAGSIAEHPEDWHVLGRIWADVGPDPAPGVAAATSSAGVPG